MRRVRHSAAIRILLVALGCSFSQPVPRPERYVLVAARSGTALPGGGGVLRMERVRVTSPFERQRFIYRTGEASFESDFYRQFEAPPGVLVRQATREWLDSSGLFDVVLDGGGELAPAWLLEGEVHELYADLRRGAVPTAVLSLEFRLLDARSPAPAVVLQRRYEESVAAASPRPEALVAAWSELLGRVLRALEADLRSVVRR